MESSFRWLKREIFSPETNDEVPKCEQCSGVVRPNVVLFGKLKGGPGRGELYFICR